MEVMHDPAIGEPLANFFIQRLGVNSTRWEGLCLLCRHQWHAVMIQTSEEALAEVVRHMQTTHRVSNHLTGRRTFAWSLEEPQDGHIRGALWTQPMPR